MAAYLGCEGCAHVYLAIIKKDGLSSMEQIIRDTGITQKTVKRHLNRLLTLGLVAHTISGYEIAKELDSVKKWREKKTHS